MIDAMTSENICQIIVYGENTIKYSLTTSMSNLSNDNTLFEINYSLLWYNWYYMLLKYMKHDTL